MGLETYSQTTLGSWESLVFNSAPILQRESVDSIQLSRINKSGEVLSCEYTEGWCVRVLQARSKLSLAIIYHIPESLC